MKINLDAPSDDVRIEIIPLIDIIFCILTFFILVALQVTRQQAINVDLPTAKNGAASQMRENLIVTLLDQDHIYIEQQQINSVDQFTQSLKNYRATNPNGALVLRASKNVSYDLVIQVLDLMKKVGGDRVALATESVGSPVQAPNPNNGVPPSVVPPGTVPPGMTPYPGGSVPVDPYNPSTTPYNPTQPQLPGAPGQSLPDPAGINPINPGGVAPYPTAPNSGTTTAPKQDSSAPKR